LIDAPSDSERYAEREAQAVGLETFEGGFHGVILFAAVFLIHWGHRPRWHHPPHHHSRGGLDVHPHGLDA
jgi:hypothetical protein